MTEEEKKDLLLKITQNAQGIGQINFGDGYQDCTFNNGPKVVPLAEDADFQEMSNEEDAGNRTQRNAGRPSAGLFTDLFGNKDKDTTEQEAKRVKEYLSKHGFTEYLWTSSQDNPMMNIVICFVNTWKNQNKIEGDPSPAGIFNFFTKECGVKLGQVDKKSITGKFPDILKHECDAGILAEIETLFKK